MSITKLYIHCNWSTKNRFPYLDKNLRRIIFKHMIENGELHGISIEQINGWVDHVHLLISLHPTQNISSIIHSLKGESSCWINKQKILELAFEWQDGYFAETVHHKNLNHIRNYISNQESHHTRWGYLDELKNGFGKFAY